MKSRVLITVLVVALAAAAIGGATLAWFTDSATSEDVTFAAGTLLINVDDEPVVTAMEDRDIENVNPGDCATVCWNIVNEGTKSAELRAQIDAGWVNASNEPQVAFFAPVPDSGWVMYEEDGKTWLYYTGGPVAGTYGNEAGESAETVSLCLVVGFDGPLMGNDYQGESYVIGGKVEAIQASNGAPETAWGEALATVTDVDYDDSNIALMGYFLEGNGASMNCWTSCFPPDPIVPGEEVPGAKITRNNSASYTGSGTWNINANDVKISGAEDLNGNLLEGTYNLIFLVRNHPEAEGYKKEVTFSGGKAGPLSFKTSYYIEGGPVYFSINKMDVYAVFGPKN